MLIQLITVIHKSSVSKVSMLRCSFYCVVVILFVCFNKKGPIYNSEVIAKYGAIVGFSHLKHIFIIKVFNTCYILLMNFVFSSIFTVWFTALHIDTIDIISTQSHYFMAILHIETTWLHLSSDYIGKRTFVWPMLLAQVVEKP